MQRFYETLFQQYDVACAQILVTDADFRVREVERALNLLFFIHIIDGMVLFTSLESGESTAHAYSAVGSAHRPYIERERRHLYQNDAPSGLSGKFASRLLPFPLKLQISDLLTLGTILGLCPLG